MKEERKRVAMPVICVLGTALVLGLLLSLFIGFRHDGDAFWSRLLFGVVGPFWLAWWMLFNAPIVVSVCLVLFLACVAAVVRGVRRCRRVVAISASVLLSILWLVAMFLVCMMSNLS